MSVWQPAARALLAPVLLGLALTATPASRAQSGESPAAPTAPSAPAFGLRFDPGRIGFVGPPIVPAVQGVPPEAGPWALLPADWAEIETGDGVYDWSMLVERAAALRGLGWRVGVILDGSHPGHLPEGGLPRVDRPGSIEAWLRFARSAVRSFSGEASWFQIREDWPAGEAEAYAYLLKNTALALRAEARLEGPGAEAALRVAQAPWTPERMDEQRLLWDRGSAAYVDVLPVRERAGGPGVDYAALAGEVLRHPPASVLWAVVDAPEGAGRGARPTTAVRALAAGAAAAVVQTSEDEARLPELGGWIVRAHALLTAGGYAPAPLGELALETAAGEPRDGARGVARFFGEEDFSTLIFFENPGETDALPDDRLRVGTRLVRDAEWIDLSDGRAMRVATAPTADGEGRAIRVGRGAYPMAVRYKQGAPPGSTELPPEEIETEGTRDLTADEVIARHQQTVRNQADRLQRWIARGRVDLHFKLAQAGSSIDVSIESNYFWEEGQPLEWEQTDYWINGNPVRWKKIPELPLIQPEKVVTLPLDLTLDKTYAYRSVGRDRVGGRDAYALEFQPVDPDAPLSLYRGRVWIDAETFRLLRSSVIQTGLESPVLSNEEVDLFGAHESGGETYWLLDSVDGQQTWNATGRTFVVQREVTFLDYEINPPVAEFRERKEAAYASRNQMLRDTESGFRYLERTEDGGRQVKETVDTDQLFAAAGVLRDSGTGDALPLAGVNWFDYDLGGRNVQSNVFFAGAFLFATASKPDLLGGKMDATADLALWGVKTTDDVYVLGEEVVPLEVARRPASLSLRAGFPVHNFLKINLVGNATHRTYDRTSDQRDAIAALNDANPAQSLRFVLPQDHLETSARLSVEFNRRGWSLVGEGAAHRRSDWEPWGLFDDAAGSYVDFDPATDTWVPVPAPDAPDSFRRWRVGVAKEWYLPKFQKIGLNGDWLDGEDMDRFSRYGFSFFGDDSLFGFSGSGVRFDEGVIGRAGWSFNLFEVLRFNVALEQARVRDDLPGAERRTFTGAGLSANFVGPWRTVINVDYGYAVQSDIEPLEGESEFLILVFKLF